MMPHKKFNILKILLREKRASSHIPYSHLISPSIIALKNGMLMSVIKLNGVPFQTELNEELNYFHMIWHQFILQLSDEFSVYVAMHRKKIDPVLSGKFTDRFAQNLNQKSNEKHKYELKKNYLVYSFF